MASEATPFYKQIEEDTQIAIKEQIEHLQKLENEEEGDSKIRYRYMKEGAEQVLSLLRQDSLSRRGTKEWLSKLDYQQLIYAQECVNNLVKEKEAEKRVQLWNVYTEHSLNYFFREEKDAKKKALELLMIDIEKENDENNELIMKKVYIRESEVDEYLQQ